jgi:hypothetical protein
MHHLEQKSPRAGNRQGDAKLIAVLAFSGIAITVLITLIVLGAFREKRIPPLPPLPEETPEVRFREIAAGFNAPPAEGNRSETAAIRELLNFFSKSPADRTETAAGDVIDLERHYQEVIRSSRLVHTLEEQREFIRGMEEFLVDVVRGTAVDLLFDEVDLRHCDFSADGTGAVAFVKTKTGAVCTKYRFWLLKRNGRWRVYDHEDLDNAHRWSKSFAENINLRRHNPAAADESRKMSRLMNAANRAMASGNLEEADRCYGSVNPESLDPLMKSVYYVGQGNLQYHRGKLQEALAQYNLAGEANPRMARIPLLRAVVENNLGEFETAVRESKQYMDMVGNDALAFEQMAFALESLGRKDEAISAYRRSLDDEPNAVGSLCRLAPLLPATGKPEVGDHYAKMKRTPEQFEVLFDWLRPRDYVSLQEIAKQYTSIAPRSPKLALLAAEEKFDKQDYAGAAEQAKAALAAGDQKIQYQLERVYCRSMIKLDRIQEAYREIAQKDVAFGILATWSAQDKKFDDVRQLVDQYRAVAPDDPWIRYFSGLVAIHDRRVDDGLKQLRDALELARDEETRQVMHNRLVREMFDAGKSLEAYAQLEPKATVFQQLALTAVEQRKPDVLQSLIDARTPDEPRAVVIGDWEMRLAYLKQDYAAAIEIAHRQRAAWFNVQDGNWFLAESYLIRSLIHLRQFAEAEEKVKQLNPTQFNPDWFRAEIAAAQGDVAQTAANLEKLVAVGHIPQDFYGDDILSAALRSDAFKSLREKYPEPPESAKQTQ